MYTLAIRRAFIARHYLVGGDWGAENLPNSHRYVLELQLEGAELDQYGFLCDLIEVEAQVSAIMGRYREKMLNDLPEFGGLNPSLEHFARILATSLSARIHSPLVTGVRVVLWEDEEAWAAFSVRR